MHTVMLDDPVDLDWLREVHLQHFMVQATRKLDLPEFLSAVLEGNEDAPDRVFLYQSVCPTVFDEPVRVLVPDRKGQLV